MQKTLHTFNPKLGSFYALLSFLHVVIGVYLGALYHNQANSEFDKLLLNLINALYTLKDAF